MATGIRINYIRIPAVCFWMHIVLVSIRFYAKVQKCAEYVFSGYSSLDKLYNKTILPILNGEVSLPDVFGLVYVSLLLQSLYIEMLKSFCRAIAWCSSQSTDSRNA